MRCDLLQRHTPFSHVLWFLPRTFRHCLIYCCNSLICAVLYRKYIAFLWHRMSKTGDDDEGVCLYLNYHVFLLSSFMHNHPNLNNDTLMTVQLLSEVPELSSSAPENPIRWTWLCPRRVMTMEGFVCLFVILYFFPAAPNRQQRIF